MMQVAVSGYGNDWTAEADEQPPQDVVVTQRQRRRHLIPNKGQYVRLEELNPKMIIHELKKAWY